MYFLLSTKIGLLVVRKGLAIRRAPFRTRGWLCAFQPGLALNRQGQELSPNELSLRSPTAIMITCSNSPGLGSGVPNHYAGD
jgi:hypothetical protein